MLNSVGEIASVCFATAVKFKKKKKKAQCVSGDRSVSS